MIRSPFGWLLGIVVVALVLSQFSKSSAQKSPCYSRGRVALAAVVICPAGLSDGEWRAAGKHACRDQRACNAWIWDDPNAAPSSPPTFGTPMTDAQVDAAVAVWVNKAQSLRVCAISGC